MKIFGIEFQIPAGTPLVTLNGENADVKVYDNGDGTATAVYNRSSKVTKEEAFQEFSLSQVNDECKKHSLELGRIVFN